jgi:hypothetical protein
MVAPAFDYDFVTIRDLDVKSSINEKTGRRVVEAVAVNGERLDPSNRFWNSLFARYGINSAFFKYYEYEEVFSRISEVEANDRLRICVERQSDGKGRLLAVSNPAKPLVAYNELQGLLDSNESKFSYHDGIVESTHEPRVGGHMFAIKGDQFQNRFVMCTPIDGYGAPNVYLSLLRMICTNGVIGYSKVFKSAISLGKASDNVVPALERVIDGFGSDEGYAAIRERVEASMQSWASVHEALSLHQVLHKGIFDKTVHSVSKQSMTDGTSLKMWYDNRIDERAGWEGVEARSPMFDAFEAMTGNIMRTYGVANVDAFSPKKQRTLPVRCTVYDLINFATEVASHHAEAEGARKIQAWVGDCLANEYDMEGTRDKITDFKDFHLAPGVGSTTHEAAMAS